MTQIRSVVYITHNYIAAVLKRKLCARMKDMKHVSNVIGWLTDHVLTGTSSILTLRVTKINTN